MSPRTQSRSAGADTEEKPVAKYTLVDVRAALATGCAILATRAYPFPHRYWLVASAEAAEAGDFKPEHEVRTTFVQRLVDAAHVTARMLDRTTGDTIVYRLTEKGRAVVAAATPTPKSA